MTLEHLTDRERHNLGVLINTCQIKHICIATIEAFAQSLNGTRAALQVATEELHQVRKERDNAIAERDDLQLFNIELSIQRGELMHQVANVVAERDRLRDKLQTSDNFLAFERMKTEWMRAQRERDRMRAALESVEFVHPKYAGDCPWCLRQPPDHSFSCQRQAALGETACPACGREGGLHCIACSIDEPYGG